MIMQKGVEKGALLAPSPTRFQLKSNSERVITWGFFYPLFSLVYLCYLTSLSFFVL